MSKKKPKTTGLTFIEYSLASFNGSGYADRRSPEDFINSFIAYLKWRKRDEHLKLAIEFYVPLLALAEDLYFRSETKTISDKNKFSFAKIYPPILLK